MRANRQTDRQTYRHAHRNTSHPLGGRSNNMNVTKTSKQKTARKKNGQTKQKYMNIWMKCRKKWQMVSVG